MAVQFVNPYNFFPLGEKKTVQSERPSALYSGVIKYRVLTKTPLLIPETEKVFLEPVLRDNVEKKHPHYVFASLRDLSSLRGELSELEDDTIRCPAQPYIPGSEMRGMIRSVYEMLTDSCLSTLNDDEILSKRTHEVFQAGLLKKAANETFVLYKAEDCLLRLKDPQGNPPEDDDWIANDTHFQIKSYTTKAFSEGEKRTFYIQYRKKEKYPGKWVSAGKPLAFLQPKDNAEACEGWVLKGLSGPSDMKDKITKLPDYKAMKHNCHVFILEGDNSLGPVDLKLLEDVLRIYKENGQNVYSEYAHSLNTFKKGPVGAYFPVYYSRINTIGKIYLSPAAITREIYTRRIKDSVKGFTPCNANDDLCPACRLFGTVNTDRAVSSKIRFSDLTFSRSEKGSVPDYTEAQTLIPLSTPKISNMEFYLERPADNAVFWTYDYYIDDKGIIHPNDKWINGRKFYWNHSGEVLTTEEKSDQNRTVYPLNTGNVFVGELYFDCVSSAELENLYFVLNGGEAPEADLRDRKHCYKLGAAKPAGLGSISLKVDKVLCRKATGGEYRVEPWISQQAHELKHLEDFGKMTSFIPQKVNYPRVTEDGPIFEWFSSNHKGFKDKNGVRKEDRSPTRRLNEYFGAYMLPMQTRLGVIPMPGTEECSGQSGGVPTADRPAAGNGRSSGNASAAGKSRAPERVEAELEVGQTYPDASIIGVYTNGAGKEFFNLSINGGTVVNGKFISIPKHRAKGKSIGDTVSVRYNGLNDGGYPEFWVNH